MSRPEVPSRLHPKLRMLRNGDDDVQALRAEFSASVVSTRTPEGKGENLEAIGEMLIENRLTLSDEAGLKLGRRKKLKDRPKPDHAFVNVFIELVRKRRSSGDDEGRSTSDFIAALEKDLGHVPDQGAMRSPVAIARNFVSACIPIVYLDELIANKDVAFVHRADPVKLDMPTINWSSAGALAPKSRRAGPPSRDVSGGKPSVLIGLIDVGGYDFAHPEFLDHSGKKTRFERIWDQGGDFRPNPNGYTYGAEFRKSDLDAAISDSAKPGGLPAVMLERQSQMLRGSHGTHVASIAAGNRGVCPNARIAGVLVDLPRIEDDNVRRRTTFSDSSRILDAVQYLLALAEDWDLPVAINISLGTNGGSHDGGAGTSRWMDALLATPGRSICVASGNAGQEAPTEQGDIGWVMGRIHSSGRIPARGLDVDLQWTVVGNGLADVSENELEIWYGAQDRISISVKPPSSSSWITVQPGQFVENKRLPSGTTLSIYNELYHPVSGDNYIAVYLTPNLRADDFRPVEAGLWTVRLHGEEIRDGQFHCWIERDDLTEIGRWGGQRLFRFPSFFSAASNVDSHSINSLACGNRVLAVANLDETKQSINITSSQGPTRDGRQKPDIAAPGTDIVAAKYQRCLRPTLKPGSTSCCT